MDAQQALSGGVPQEAIPELARETYPGRLNITFTRGFVLSQAFVNRYEDDGPIETLIGERDDPLTFIPTHSEAGSALPWMGFEARRAILDVLEVAINDPQAEVSAIAYHRPRPARFARDPWRGIFVQNNNAVVLRGISDRPVGGLHVLDLHGNPVPVAPASLGAGLPEPFSEEPRRTGVGNYMHHKFVVIDFDTPNARVYLGSYNFSRPADEDNGENPLLFRDRRIATAYAIEALRIYDHYAFRASPQTAVAGAQPLRRPPGAGEVAWWDRFYTDEVAKRDRLKFA